MEIISRKTQIESIMDLCLQDYKGDLSILLRQLNENLLKVKVRFPMLEYSAEILSKQVGPGDQILLCDMIHSLQAEGGNVIIGKLLQLKLNSSWQLAIDKATQYIQNADAWYVCDIIGERVYGVSLLHFPARTINVFRKKLIYENHWVVRASGAGIHYAIKKGLDREHALSTFDILLSQAHAVNKEIRQGIGWAAKTTARFHPDIILSFKEEIADTTVCSNWFRKKIKMGLERNRHAQRN